ncbi:MAG TPA: 50S ribosomal protein L4 [Spirochaetota bacterium]|jgi:large subunit ribosomal protein L4|nr:50S ribosomal protein L4 [Spirochaetota bacterium]HOA07238.1 50S ribosomal protein L4 [Spirochaetota bacterium]HOF33242.1 50S ribosomal protein L4 [Spirochaetota bacterium]HOH36213.1 50S ribosomal protein L4 [Spirochaetota bacterium]HOR44038.1 50S ribosomal protein L4 [Spirochaetota bacterium]
MLIDKYSIDGQKLGQVELNDSVFAAEINDVLLYEFIKAANANLRQGTHSTKERSFVSGGGKKPWKQKGTGRARQGSIRSPQWRGGGIVFGPRPRSYKVELPKSLKSAAYRSIFSVKAKESALKVIADFDVESGKTKDMQNILNKLGVERGVLVALDRDVKTRRAIRNIAGVKYNDAKLINGRDIFYSKQLLMTEGAVKYINEKYSKVK